MIKVEGIGLDVTKNESLLEVMSKVDIVVNTTGPFFKFAEPILRASIETNYVVILIFVMS